MLQLLRDLFDPLFNLMGFTLQSFHGWGAPWWLSIVMLTVIVRSLLFPLTFRQVKSMRRMQELKPEMDEIRKKHKDDQRTQQQEMIKLYGERKVNPLGGCLPLFVQFPIFIVLYYTIKQFEHLESFRTGGLLWFQDLTVQDPYFVLPVLYVGTMMISQEISMRNTAPEQRKIMRFLPIVFGFVLSHFPAGLFVYWVCSNCITITQNYIIYNVLPDNRSHTPKAEEPAAEEPEETKPAERPGDEAPIANRKEQANGTTNTRTRTKRRKKAKKRR